MALHLQASKASLSHEFKAAQISKDRYSFASPDNWEVQLDQGPLPCQSYFDKKPPYAARIFTWQWQCSCNHAKPSLVVLSRVSNVRFVPSKDLYTADNWGWVPFRPGGKFRDDPGWFGMPGCAGMKEECNLATGHCDMPLSMKPSVYSMMLKIWSKRKFLSTLA